MTNAENDRQWSGRLRYTWGWLAGLTILSLSIVLVAGRMESGLIAAIGASALSYYKSRLLLDHFLDLRDSTPAWRSFFHGMVATILILVLLAYALPFIPVRF